MPEDPGEVLKSGGPVADEDNVNKNQALPLLIRAYDRGVLACTSGDFVASHRAIGTLRAALPLDTGTSRAFDVIFHWCERAVDRGDYSGAARCLAALRDAWLRSSDFHVSADSQLEPSRSFPPSPVLPA